MFAGEEAASLIQQTVQGEGAHLQNPPSFTATPAPPQLPPPRGSSSSLNDSGPSDLRGMRNASPPPPPRRNQRVQPYGRPGDGPDGDGGRSGARRRGHAGREVQVESRRGLRRYDLDSSSQHRMSDWSQSTVSSSGDRSGRTVHGGGEEVAPAQQLGEPAAAHLPPAPIALPPYPIDYDVSLFDMGII